MLLDLTLENFRNHDTLKLKLEQKTVIVGPNGAGKSNIIEAISLISYLRSYREDDKRCLINKNSYYARVTSGDIEVFLQKNPTFLIKVREKGIFKKQSEVIGKIRTVVFSPETCSLITASPKNRRKFLDILISQKDKDYLRALVKYESIRREKNSLLKMIREGRAGMNELDFWNNELAEAGKKIIKKRQRALGFLNETIPSFYQEISANKEDRLRIDYLPNIKDDLNASLAANKHKEVAIGLAIIGPHRDDLSFKLNSLEVENYASRGELRSAILALKLAEAEYLVDKDRDIKPTLLLDDIFSEFDQKRRQHLLTAVSNFQVVITTTDKENLKDDFLKTANIVKL